MNNPPRVSSWLEVPKGCRMEALLDFDGALHFTLGNSIEDWQHIVFDRPALERFVHLAREALELREPGRRAGQAADSRMGT